MGRKVRIAVVGALLLLAGALLVQQSLGAPGAEPSIASDVRVGVDQAAPPAAPADGSNDDTGNDRNDVASNGNRRDDDKPGEDRAPDGDRDRDRDDDGVQQVNPGAQTIDGDDGALDDTDDADDGGDD